MEINATQKTTKPQKQVVTQKISAGIKLSALSMALALAGCGGGPIDVIKPGIGSGGVGSGGSKAAPKVSQSKILLNGTEVTQVDSNGGTFQVQILDANGHPVKNQRVNFSADNSSIIFQDTSNAALTDNNGIAQIGFSAKDRNLAGVYTLTAVAKVNGSSVETTKDFNLKALGGQGGVSNEPQLSDSKIVVDGTETNSVSSNGGYYLVTVLDSKGKPVSNQKVNFAVDSNQIVFTNSSASALTNSSGLAKIGFYAKDKKLSGVYTITATAEVENKNISIKKNFNLIATGETPVTQNYLLKANVGSSTLTTGGDTSSIKILVTDDKGGVIPDVPVNFRVINSATSGLSLTKPSVIKTAADGSITTGVALSSDSVDARLNHDMQVEAYVESGSRKTLTYFARGTTIELTTDKANVDTGGKATVTVTLKDGKNNPISGATVVLQDKNGITVSTTGSASTDSNGKAMLTVDYASLPFDSAGNAVLKAKVSGNQISQVSESTLTITAIDKSGISFVDIDETKLYPVGTNVKLPVQIRVERGQTLDSLVGKTIELQTTLGKFVASNNVLHNYTITAADVSAAGSSATELKKDFFLNLDNPGGAVIKAKLDNAEASANFRVVATDPSKLLLQTSKTVIAPGESTEIIAIVKNDKDVPVEGQTVIFSKPSDSSAGSLSNTIAKTDALGMAKIKFTAGSVTPDKGVTIDATVLGHESIPSQPNQVFLTVSKTAAYITLGLSDKLVVGGNNVYYFKNASASVVDAAGKPIANQPVTVKLFAHSYKVGRIIATKDANDKNIWVQAATDWVPSEDKNRNFTLDPGEDGSTIRTPVTNFLATASSTYRQHIYNALGYDNGNNKCESTNSGSGSLCYTDGVLQAKNPVVIEGGTLANGVYNFRTDDQGKFDFKLRYPKGYGDWLRLEIGTDTNVSGSEFSNVDYYDLEVAEGDVELGDNAKRPNWISPYNNTKR